VIQLTQLEIDECIDWILNTVEFKKEFSYKYAFGEGWEFLIFSTGEYYLDNKALIKIERTAGMILVQIKTSAGNTELWFGRKMEFRAQVKKKIA
jgi:hypothetical protein